mgnify:CR=1 FL=1
MAKRRARPLNNPIRQDLIDGVMKPIVPAAPPRPHPEDPSVGEGSPAAETLPQKPIAPRPTKKRKPRATPPRQKDLGSRWTEPKFVQIKARFVHEEAEEIELIRRKISELTRCNVSMSHLTRALWSLAQQTSEDLEGLASKAPQLQRPPHGNPIATAEYEDELARFLLKALKQLRPSH